MTPQINTESPPAQRLVLFVADGLRADKFFETDLTNQSRAPFLHKIMQTGSYGISHARVPTESRPGHVALIAGFYEDVSAVAKGWKVNPVEFDSLFNESFHTWSWGSPDILPMFAEGLSHVEINCYEANVEDFASEMSILDDWVFDKVEQFFASSKTNETLNALLHSPKIILFLHLLATDSLGHAYRPDSEAYLSHISKLDSAIEHITLLIDSFYNDSRTAYIFTSDHGMSAKGSHGDGDQKNTETPFAVWGPGIDSLQDFQNVNQADLCPLMATLIGIPFPMNSVGLLPHKLLTQTDLTSKFVVSSLYTNLVQMYEQYHRKFTLKKQSTLSFLFSEYPDLTDPQSQLAQIHTALSHLDRLTTAEYTDISHQISQLIESLLNGLHYYQTYDRFILFTTITTGYVSWILYLFCFILTFYTKHPQQSQQNRNTSNPFSKEDPKSKQIQHKKNIGFIISVECVLMVCIATFNYLNSYEWSYYVYMVFPVLFLYDVIVINLPQLLAVQLTNLKTYVITTSKMLLVLLIVETLVVGFYYRELYGVLLIALGVFLFLRSCFQSLTQKIPTKQSTVNSIYFGRALHAVWIVSCVVLGVFPFLSVEFGENVSLVILGGLLYLSTASVVLFKLGGLHKYGKGVLVGLLLVAVAVWIVYDTTLRLVGREGLSSLNQAVSWTILCTSFVIVLGLSYDSFEGAYMNIATGLAAPYILLSISYESIFYYVLVVNLFMWYLAETASETATQHTEERSVNSGDIRRALFFVFYCYVTFFGTGNIASISSFEVSSTFRFLTVFKPFLMLSLLLWKVLLPFVLVSCIFRGILRATSAPEAPCFFLVIAFADLMSINFLFLVQDYGSWKEIGMSISHFAISNMFILFALSLFGVSKLLLRNLGKPIDKYKLG